MGVVLGLIPRWGQGHGEARAGVSLSRSGMAWMQKTNKLVAFKQSEIKLSHDRLMCRLLILDVL